MLDSGSTIYNQVGHNSTNNELTQHPTQQPHPDVIALPDGILMFPGDVMPRFTLAEAFDVFNSSRYNGEIDGATSMIADGTNDIYQYAQRRMLRFIDDPTHWKAIETTSRIRRPEYIDEITKHHIVQFRQHLLMHDRFSELPNCDDSHGKLAASTVRNIMVMCAVAFNFFVDYGMIKESPFQGVKRPPVPVSTDVKAISDADFERVLNYVASGYRGTKLMLNTSFVARNTALIYFFGETGCRVEGAASAKISDITQHSDDLWEVRLREKGRGGKKARSAFLKGEAVIALELWLDERERLIRTYPGVICDSIFIQLEHNPGQPISKESMSKYIKRLGAQAGCAGAHNAHAYRHRRCITLLRNGMPMAEVSRYMGHTSIAFTIKYYGRFSTEQIRESFAKYS